jgi:NAD(P)-dependent dehydrogenase (short-subunit alcohol dehydrogenase family)
MNLSNKTILITGAAGGLGSALSMQCAGQGANLVLLDKNRRALSALSDKVTAQGMEAPGLYPMDLSGAGIEDFAGLVNILQSEFGGLDGLIHCALDFESLQPLEQIEPQQWLKSMQVNVNAPWLLSCACLPLLRQAEAGRLFFMLDDPERITGAYWGAYGTGKSALSGLVKQFEASLNNTQVVVRGINPGAMRTDFRARVYHAENPLTQAEPMIAAKKIANMLTGDISATPVLVDLTVEP